MIIGKIVFMGIFFFVGFFLKDVILEVIIIFYFNVWVLILILIVILFIVVYSFWIIYLVCLGSFWYKIYEIIDENYILINII